MKDVVYIVCDEGGALRMTKRAPAMSRHEAAIRLTVSVPDECFRSWAFGATVEVPADRVIQPEIAVVAEASPVSEGDQ